MRIPNIKIQLHNRLNKMISIGVSRKDSKKSYKKFCMENNIKVNPTKSATVHSYNTLDAYRQTINEFTAWLKQNEPEIWNSKDLKSVNKNICYKYLKFREDDNKSSYTISKDMSALNRMFNFDLTKKEGNLNKRSYKKIIRSRGYKDMDNHINFKNYKEQICFSYSFGLRRNSIFNGQYSVKDVSLLDKNDKIYCCVIEKGGKYRETPCLSIMQNYIKKHYTNIHKVSVSNPQENFYSKEQFKEIYSKSTNKLFNKYPKRIDNHSFRAKYAKQLYKEYYSTSNDNETYRGYNKESILKVSKALGHNRPSVVVEHYLK